MKKKAAVFWDYESFFYGLHNQHQYIPTREYLIDVISRIKAHYEISQIQAFGAFNEMLLEKERSKLRSINVEVIDCTPTQNQYGKKDFTDFIMLGSIYQTLIRTLKGNNNIEAYVLITGDGHFSTVAAQLTNDHEKEVGFIGVLGCLRQDLKAIGSWHLELQPGEQKIKDLKEKIEATMKHVESLGIEPSFQRTSEQCSRYYQIDHEKVKTALMQIIKMGYIEQQELQLENGSIARVLIGEWRPEFKGKADDYYLYSC
jgi:hypothetical protein